MGWGRIDDEFDEHPKVLAILDENETVEAALAIALWTLCLTWAHRNTRKRGKVPGLIPSGLPRRYFGGDARRGIEVLIKHRLWDVTDGGWLIHDFGDYLPTEKTREERAAAGRKGAAARWHKNGSTEATPSQPDSNLLSEDGSLLQDDGNAMASHGKPLANDGSRTPARRDPIPTPVTHTQTQTQSSKAEDQTPLVNAARRPEPETLPGTDQALIPIDDIHTASVNRASRDAQFDAYWKPYPRKVGKQGARKVWDTKVKNGADPDAITAGAVAFAEHVRAWQTPEDKIPHPSTWLNAGRWEDVLPPPPGQSLAVRDDRGGGAVLPDGRTLNRKTVQHVNHLAAYGGPPDA